MLHGELICIVHVAYLISSLAPALVLPFLALIAMLERQSAIVQVIVATIVKSIMFVRRATMLGLPLIISVLLS